MVATAGWAETSGLSLWEVADLYPDARHLLVTDIGRDGMMTGPNLELLDRGGRAPAASRGAGLGRRLLARRSARRCPARRRDRRPGALGRHASTLAEAIERAGALGSSPASTSRTAASSRASSSATIATSATSSSMRSLSRRGRRRAGLLRHHRQRRRPQPRHGLGPPHRRGDRHPLRRRRRHPQPRPGRRLPGGGRGQGLDQLARARRPGADRASWPATSAASASSSASTASSEDGDYWVQQYTGSVEATRDTGRRTLDWVARGDGRAAPARSCSTACAMTASAPATTSPHTHAVIDARQRAGHRLGRRRRARTFPRRLRSRRQRRARRHRLPRPPRSPSPN